MGLTLSVRRRNCHVLVGPDNSPCLHTAPWYSRQSGWLREWPFCWQMIWRNPPLMTCLHAKLALMYLSCVTARAQLLISISMSYDSVEGGPVTGLSKRTPRVHSVRIPVPLGPFSPDVSHLYKYFGGKKKIPLNIIYIFVKATQISSYPI